MKSTIQNALNLAENNGTTNLNLVLNGKEFVQGESVQKDGKVWSIYKSLQLLI